MRLFALVLLAACAPATTVDGDTADDDTGTGDTADDDDTGTDEPANLSFAVTGDLTGATFNLSWIDASTFGSESLTFGDAIVSAPAADPQELALEAPPESQLIEADPENQTGTFYAFYLPSLHYDTDGDGAHTSGEVIVGAGRWWPLYITGTLSAEVEAMGLELGWNSVNYLDGEPQFGGAFDIPLAANLVPVSEVNVSGTAAEGLVGSNFAVLSGMAFSGATPPTPLYDGELAANWSVSLSEAPGEDHFYDVDGKGTMAAMEALVAYTDADSSGDYSNGDGVTAVACHDQRVAILAWLPPPTEMINALQAFTQPGWNVMAAAEGSPPALLTAEESADLRFGPECATEDEPPPEPE